MAEGRLSRESDSYDSLARRIASAAAGSPAAFPAGAGKAEFEAISDLAGAPRRILTAGPGAAYTALVMALAWPDADLVAVDPDISEADGEAAARLLDIDHRVRFHTGGFASPAGNRPQPAPAVGRAVCDAEPDFDLVVIDGPSDAATRAADLRLAASALAPQGLVAMRGLTGRRAATVRAGAFDFLRYNPGFHYLGLEVDGAVGGLGLFRHKAAGWFADLPQPQPAGAGDVSEGMQAGLADQVAQMAGGAPVVEAAVGVGVLDVMRSGRGGDAVLQLSPNDVARSYVDPVVDRIAAAMEAAPGSVLFSGDLTDFASDELLTRLFDRLGDRGLAAVLAVTPPGEAGVAGPAARPAARVIDLAASQGLAAYAPAGMEFETVRHSDARAAVSSRHLSLLMFAKAGGRRDAANRALVERTPASAAQHEQVELQRLVDQAALQAEAASHAAEREKAETREQGLAERLRAATKAADIAIDTHERARRGWADESTRLHEELKTQTSLAAAVKTALDEAQAALGRETALKKSLEVELARLQETSRREAETLRWDKQAAEAREEEMRGRLGKSRDEIAELHDEVRTLQGSLKSLGDTERGLRARIGTFDIDLAAAKRLSDSLRTQHGQQVAEMGRETSRLKVTLQDEASRAQRLLGDLQSANAELERLKAENARLGGDLAASQELFELLEREHQMVRDGHVQAAQALAAAHGEIETLKSAGAMSAEAEGELRALRDVNSRLERDAQTRAAEVRDLQQRLSDASSESIDLACREVDMKVSLDGIDAHLALSQEAVDRARMDPEGYRVAHQTYPEGAAVTGEGRTGADLVEAARTLHGRAADLSRDLGAALEAAEQRRRIAMAGMEPKLAAIRASHEEGVARARGDGSERASDAERRLSRLSEISLGNERVVRGLEATVLGADAGPLSGGAPDAEQRFASQGARLERVLHRLEAGPHPAVSASEPMLPFADEIAEEAARPDAPRERLPDVSEPVRIVDGEEEEAERPFLILPKIEPLPPEPAPEPPPRVEPARAEAETQAERPVIDDLAPLELDSDDELPGPGVLSPGRQPRGFAARAWDWLRAYRETFGLVRLQKTLDNSFGKAGFRARAFDAQYYLSQGGIPDGQDPVEHYILVGEAQGRRPLAGFDPAFYAAQLGADAPVKGTLLRHFLETGVDAGLSPSAELEPIARRALAAGQSRLEYFFRREDERRKARAARAG